MDQRLFAACDIGGTKIDAVLFDAEGHLLRRVVRPGGTVLELGFDVAVARYLAAMRELFAAADGRPIAAFYGGIACATFTEGALPRVLREELPEPAVMRIESDGPCLISGRLGHADGASMICGTGSSLCVRHGDEYHYIGGWGWVIDSCGSGFILGRDAVRRVIRAYDGRLPATMMTGLLEKKCGEPVWEHIGKLYAGGRAYFASMAEVVFEARAAGDPAAIEIFNSNVKDLADMAAAAYREFGHGYELILNGGIFTHFPEYAAVLQALCPPGVRTVMAELPPVYGGAVEALYDAGLTPTPDFRYNFLSGYDAKK